MRDEIGTNEMYISVVKSGSARWVLPVLTAMSAAQHPANINVDEVIINQFNAMKFAKYLRRRTLEQQRATQQILNQSSLCPPFLGSAFVPAPVVVRL